MRSRRPGSGYPICNLRLMRRRFSILPIRLNEAAFWAERLRPMLRARALSNMAQREIMSQRLKIALAIGDIVDLRRGELFADADGKSRDSAFIRASD